MRTFEDRPAVREATPLLIGLVGPSNSGKTFSALRLATGIQRVSGGEIFLIDTESRRALHYADRFTFRHVPFGAPFGPLEYLAAIEHCVKKGAKIVVVDSASHEHESIGGVLEMHAAEQKRLAALWKTSEDAVNMAAWNKPKTERRRLINTILQMPVNFIFCFRAKEKLKIRKGEPPKELGFQPIAGEEWIYELVLKCLLLPGASGTPTWEPEHQGEKVMIKLPEQFRTEYFRKLLAAPLSEDVGEALAKWAAGSEAKQPVDVHDLIKQYTACSDPATHRTLEEKRRAIWATLDKAGKAVLKAAADGAAKRLEDASALLEAEPPITEPPDREPGDDEELP